MQEDLELGGFELSSWTYLGHALRTVLIAERQFRSH